MDHNIRILRVVFLVGLALVLAGCGLAASPTPTPAPTSTTIAMKNLILGDISDTPAKRIAAFQPLADYLGANLSKFGIGGGQVKIAPDFDTMTQWLKNGDVDIYFDSPYPTYILSERASAQPVLRRWRDGVPQYSTVFFVKKDSPITQ